MCTHNLAYLHLWPETLPRKQELRWPETPGPPAEAERCHTYEHVWFHWTLWWPLQTAEPFPCSTGIVELESFVKSTKFCGIYEDGHSLGGNILPRTIHVFSNTPHQWFFGRVDIIQDIFVFRRKKFWMGGDFWMGHLKHSSFNRKTQMISTRFTNVFHLGLRL